MDDQPTPTADRTQQEPTTTHAAWGAGHPHLLIHNDDARFTYALELPLTRIGSGDACEVRLAGTDRVHATIEHDERDEYVLTMLGVGEMNANPTSAGTHEGARSETLRTGARCTVGAWTLVFQREEFADHGRPFGGRQGGELSDQPSQPDRPDYVSDPDAERPQPVEPPQR